MALIYLYFILTIVVAMIASIRGRAAWPWFLAAIFLSPVIAGLLVLALPRQKPAFWYSEWDEQPLPRGLVPMPANSKIRIIRHIGKPDQQRPCEIYVNGADIGAVEPGTIIDFPVPSGRLIVEARIAWAESRPLTVNTIPGQRVDIEVSNQGGPLLALWARALPTDRYLALRRVPVMPAAQIA
jgi:hypothetical protein